MKTQLTLCLLAVLFLFSTSCKRTVEGENNRWESNKQQIEKLKAKYPSFSGALNEVMRQAEAKIEEAASVTNEEEKIKVMAAANKIASPAFVTQLAGIDGKINDIEDLAAKAAQQSTDHSDRDAAWAAKSSATRAIEDARSQLRSANANSVAAATAVLESISSNLKRAESRLNDVVKAAANKKAEEEKAKADEKKEAADEKAKEEEKKAPVKCSYCGQMNPAGSTECGKCGAPIEK